MKYSTTNHLISILYKRVSQAPSDRLSSHYTKDPLDR